MIRRRNRRQVLKEMSGACAALLLPRRSQPEEPKLRIAGQDVEIQIAAVSANTVRLSLLPIQNDQIVSVPTNGSLVQTSWGDPLVKLRKRGQTAKTVKCGEVSVKVSFEPLTFAVETAKRATVQLLTVDKDSGRVTFLTGNSPLLGLGEGGPQFDRRGSVDRMHSGQGGYRLQTHGGRVPVPWLIGTSGWALFFHQPFGTFVLAT